MADAAAIDRLDRAFLTLQRNYRKRFAENAPLSTLPAFLNAASSLLNAILKSFSPQQPSPQPSAAPIRAEYLLRLTSDIADSILGYTITHTNQLDALFDFFRLLDNAWVNVLTNSNSSNNNNPSPLSTGVSTTQRVRLRNLILLIKDSCSDLDNSKINTNTTTTTDTEPDDTETDMDMDMDMDESSHGNASQSSSDDSDNVSLDQVSIPTTPKSNSNITTTVTFNLVENYHQSATSSFHNTLTLLAEL